MTSPHHPHKICIHQIISATHNPRHHPRHDEQGVVPSSALWFDQVRVDVQVKACSDILLLRIKNAAFKDLFASCWFSIDEFHLELEHSWRIHGRRESSWKWNVNGYLEKEDIHVPFSRNGYLRCFEKSVIWKSWERKFFVKTKQAPVWYSA